MSEVQTPLCARITADFKFVIYERTHTCQKCTNTNTMLEFLLPSAQAVPTTRRSVVLLNMPMDKHVVVRFLETCTPPSPPPGTTDTRTTTATAAGAGPAVAPVNNCICADGAANRLYDLVGWRSRPHLLWWPGTAHARF